jgi:hypothetical protein
MIVAIVKSEIENFISLVIVILMRIFFKESPVTASINEAVIIEKITLQMFYQIFAFLV